MVVYTDGNGDDQDNGGHSKGCDAQQVLLKEYTL